MQRIVGVEQMFGLTSEKKVFQIQTELLFEVAPKALNDRVMYTFDEDVERIEIRINIRCIRSSKLHQQKI